MRPLKVLFTYFDYPQTPFIQQDLRLLAARYTVEELPLIHFGSAAKAFRHPQVWQAVARCDVIVGWFGSSAPAVVAGWWLKKPAVLIAGGADVTSLPAIGYGVVPRALLRRLWLTLGYSLAQEVLLFSQASLAEFRALLKHQPTKGALLYLGIDGEHFRPHPEEPRHKQVLTVSYISPGNMRRKGLQTFIETARLLPQLPFHLGGEVIDSTLAAHIQSQASGNLSFLGSLNEAQLVREYQRSQIYVQVSLHEGFGVALAEAMACGCLPIVTRRGSLPEVVGDTGIYVPPEDPPALRDAALTLLDAPATAHTRARERIVALFPMAKRAAGLYAAIDNAYARRRAG